MRNQMRSVRVAWDNGTHNISHNCNSEISIEGQLLRYRYAHDVRLETNQIQVLQDVAMMDFQSKIAMLFRSELGIQNTTLPIPGQFEVIVQVKTSRPIQELPLIKVLKSVIDGLNKSIILDDRYVVSASIEYVKRSVSQPTGRLIDLLSIELLEVSNPIKQHIHRCTDVPIHVVPKKEALFLDFDDTLLSFDETDFVDAAAQKLIADGMTLNTTSELQMRFKGDVDDYDIDNMALTYFELLQAIGLNESAIHRIVLSKERSTKQRVRIMLR